MCREERPAKKRTANHMGKCPAAVRCTTNPPHPSSLWFMAENRVARHAFDGRKLRGPGVFLRLTVLALFGGQDRSRRSRRIRNLVPRALKGMQRKGGDEKVKIVL